MTYVQTLDGTLTSLIDAGLSLVGLSIESQEQEEQASRERARRFYESEEFGMLSQEAEEKGNLLETMQEKGLTNIALIGASISVVLIFAILARKG